MAKERMLGIVANGRLRRLTPIREPGEGCRLTREPVESHTPERGEINLAGYEGSVILVDGEARELWIHAAKVIEQGGPIVTELVQYVLGLPELNIDPKPHISP